MTLFLRREKGAPLTSEELDGNFETLDERIVSLEESPLQGEGLAEVIEEGDQVRLVGSYGTDFGGFSLKKTLNIYNKSLPEYAEPGELSIFVQEGTFTLLFYAYKAWRKASDGEVFNVDSY